ncbi:MAG TPA: DUF2892 domain-containing protein [Opitutus sp.]|nr:DUF2892 domain-containing protein [Opitutus sp.]
MRARALKPNVGSADAAVRFVAGIGLLALANHGWRWGWLGIVPVATAIAGFCPVHWLLGRNTAVDDRDGVPAARAGDGDDGADDAWWRDRG